MNIEYLKSIKYFLIDYTNKIKNNNDLCLMINKGFNQKYNNVIFSINLNKVDNNMKDEIKNAINIQFKFDGYDVIIYFNKDNYVYYKSNYEIPINKINEFINIKVDDLFDCDVCFKSFEKISGCHKCNFNTCDDCLIKSYVINDLRKNNEIKCLVCGYVNGTIEINN